MDSATTQSVSAVSHLPPRHRKQDSYQRGFPLPSTPSKRDICKNTLEAEYHEPVLSKCISKFRPCSCADGEKNHDLPGYLLNRLACNVDLRPAMLDTFLLRVTKLLLDVRQ